MIQSYSDIMKALANKQPDPVYFLMGEEGYFIDRVTERVEHHLLDEAELGFNQTVVYGKETALDQVLALARRYPMMAPYQVVILREAQQMSARDLQPLMAYLQQPVPSTVLLIAFRGKKLDRRTELYRKLEKGATVMIADKIPDYKISEWLRQYAREQSWSIADDALDLLVEYLGNDLSKLVNALEKMRYNQTEGQVAITAADVSAQVGASRDFNLLTLRQAVLDADPRLTAQIVQYAASNPKGMPIQPVLPMLHRLFAQMWLLEKTAPSQRETQQKKAGISTGAARQLLRALPVYQGRIPEILHLIAHYNGRAVGIENTSQTGPDALLKELLFQILPPQHSSRSA